jgi:plastocyanin
MRFRFAGVAAGALLTLGLAAACGGDDDDDNGDADTPAATNTATDGSDTPTAAADATNTPESEDPGGPIQVTAQEFAFNPTRIEITAGEEVTVEMTNRDEGVTHSFHVIAGSVDEATATFTPADGPQTLTFTIEAAGTYEFICDVHPTTMIGALVVTE